MKVRKDTHGDQIEFLVIEFAFFAIEFDTNSGHLLGRDVMIRYSQVVLIYHFLAYIHSEDGFGYN
jgi:hypothetical protein